jgi:formaldehyde-activating enzyme involved in methanogenesis
LPPMGTRWIAGVFVVALVLAGCGGDDSGEASISKEQFVAQMDAICKRANKRSEVAFASVLKAFKRGEKPSQAEYEKAVSTALVPTVKREIEEIEKLDAPSGDESEIDEIVDALEEGVETAERNPQAVIVSSDAVYGIASRLAGEYGLEVCGSR